MWQARRLDGMPALIAGVFAAGVAGMHPAHIPAPIGQTQHLRGAGLPDKAVVLADHHVVKPVLQPPVAAIHQGGAVGPGRLVGRITVFPCLLRQRVVKQHPVQPADRRAAVGLQRRQLLAQPGWRIPVVVVPVGDEFAVRQLAGQIALGANAQTLRQPLVADIGLRRDQIGNTVLAIVENDQLGVGVILHGKQRQRLWDKLAAVGGGHDAGDERGQKLFGIGIHDGDGSFFMSLPGFFGSGINSHQRACNSLANCFSSGCAVAGRPLGPPL